MGTWDTSINGSDTFNDIYQSFFGLYNLGHNPVSISKKIIEEFDEMFNDYEDRNNSLFGLAQAQWETKSLQPEIFKLVKEIIESGSDLELWKKLEADSETLQKRQIALHDFLNQISKEKEKAKRRVRLKFEFTSNKIIELVAPDKNKTFSVIESFENGVYEQTSSGMKWESGGSGIFVFSDQGKYIEVKWLDSKTLEIIHDSSIIFVQKREDFYYDGDQGTILYTPR